MNEDEDELRGEQPTQSESQGFGRRWLLSSVAAAAVTGVTGLALGRAAPPVAPSAPATALPGEALASFLLPEEHRLDGVTWPIVPPRHLNITVFSLGIAPTLHVVHDAVDAIRAATSDATSDAGVVTVVVGVAVPLAANVWPDRVSHSEKLPPFRNDSVPFTSDGDVVVQTSAETVTAVTDRVAAIVKAVSHAVPDTAVVWNSNGSRDAPTPTGTTRTPIGFIDGIINPRTPDLLAAGVWTDTGRDTYAVLRRIYVDTDFTRLPIADQEAAIGRRRDTGAPLSGGDATAQVDLFAKTQTGRLLLPPAAHARRAHPSNIGRALMLRRSYALSDTTRTGLLFLAFLNDPETFVMTQNRLDEEDDFIAHTSTDAGGVFFVPDPSRP